MSALRIGSLFSGIGGLELGLERAGVGHVVWQVERDPFCREVLAKHWPDVERFDDVCTVGASNLVSVDVICGGFPCQDVSLAGKGAGLDGARSGLWSEFARIVSELRPTFVVVENVPGLVRRGLDQVVSRLVSLGYEVEGSRLSAADLGAPHRRERLFLIAYAACEQTRAGGTMVSESERVFVRQQPRGGRGESRAGAALAPIHGGEGLVADTIPERRVWPAEPDMGRVAHGIPRRLDRLRTLGNAVVPACAEIVGRRLIEIAVKL